MSVRECDGEQRYHNNLFLLNICAFERISVLSFQALRQKSKDFEFVISLENFGVLFF